MRDQRAPRTNLETLDHLQWREIADCEDDRCEQNQPWYEAGEDGAGVDNSKSAPSKPPNKLSMKKPVTLTSVMPKMFRRYAQTLENVPGNRATTLDAFASIGLSPANRSAGNVTRLPPPASALRAPPRNAAAVSTMTVITRYL